ncbi:hypothetical protein [Ekhidna sp.]|uniref:hypothetical protein n=1 Tax=Ekhidna sp. TaxID=2608089 RepID=UPI003B50BB10
MRKLILIIGLLVAGNILLAQDKEDQIRRKREAKIEEFKERLELSDEQIADLKQLREATKPKLDEIREDESKSRSDKMRAHADIIEQNEKEIAQILDEQQLQELEEIKGEIREKRKMRREKRREHKRD